MKRKRSYMLLFLFIFIITLSPMSSLAGSSNRNTVTVQSTDKSEPYINVKITTAYYTNLDDDNYEDDVYAVTHFEMKGFSTFNIDYYVNLTLPSGTSYVYRVLITSQVASFDLQNLFYNHATESGDYIITVTAFLLNGGISYDEHVYVFDPPGSSDFGDPTFDFI